MKPLYASALTLLILATPGLEARGFTVQSPDKTKSVNAKSGTAKTASARNAIQNRRGLTGNAAQPRTGVRTASIQLSRPSLLEQARTLTREEVLARFDQDLDGKLNAKEASAARKESHSREAIKADLLKRFDDNKNGRLDAAEMSRARAEFAATRRAKVLNKYDANHNGLLDPKERKRLQEDRQRESARIKLQKRFDLNHDNQLDALEAAALEHYKRGLAAPKRQANSHKQGVTSAPKTIPSKAVRAKTGNSEPAPGNPASQGSKPAVEQRKTLKTGPTEGFALPSPGR